jgi:DNA polymerase (family 10)
VSWNARRAGPATCKVLSLYKTLGITSLAGLEQAARKDRIKGAKGLGVRCRQRFSEASRSRASAKAVSTCTARQFFSLQQAHPELNTHHYRR